MEKPSIWNLPFVVHRQWMAHDAEYKVISQHMAIDELTGKFNDRRAFFMKTHERVIGERDLFSVYTDLIDQMIQERGAIVYEDLKPGNGILWLADTVHPEVVDYFIALLKTSQESLITLSIQLYQNSLFRELSTVDNKTDVDQLKLALTFKNSTM